MLNLRLDINKEDQPNPISFLRIGDGNSDGLTVTVNDGELSGDDATAYMELVDSLEGVDEK